MNVVQVNYEFIEGVNDPDALLHCFRTLTGWSEGVLSRGACRVSVVQRFPRDARIVRNSVEYVFVADSRAWAPAVWRSSGRMHETVAEQGPTIVHVNGLEFGRQIQSLRQRLPAEVPILVQDHGSVPPSEGADLVRRTRARSRYAGLSDADGFLFTAHSQVDPWRGAGLISPTQRAYAVVESSTDLSPIPRPAARSLSAVDGAPALLWVGRLNANKDPLSVLDGFEKTSIPAATLTMAYHEADLLDEVRSRVDASAYLRDRVRLVGRIAHEALPAYYSAADLFVLGSHREGSGYALIEACACGTTPVVTDIPAFRSITGNGAVGALWPCEDSDELARALGRLVTIDTSVLGQATRAHFERTLTWAAIGRDALEAYADAVARRAGSR